MKLGYIQRINLELNPDIIEPFRFKECSYTIKITSKSKKVYSKMFCPLDYEEVEENTQDLKNNPSIMLVKEPVFLDDDLRERMVRWVEWANKAEAKEYDPWVSTDEEDNG